jgi:hypothetical protein
VAEMFGWWCPECRRYLFDCAADARRHPVSLHMHQLVLNAAAAALRSTMPRADLWNAGSSELTAAAVYWWSATSAVLLLLLLD